MLAPPGSPGCFPYVRRHLVAVCAPGLGIDTRQPHQLGQWRSTRALQGSRVQGAVEGVHQGAVDQRPRRGSESRESATSAMFSPAARLCEISSNAFMGRRPAHVVVPPFPKP